MTLTGETITDEQIREWEADECERLLGIETGVSLQERWAAIDLATVALTKPIEWESVRSGKIDAAVANEHNRRRDAARARCADRINARTKDQPK